jgi:hypothetical protein
MSSSEQGAAHSSIYHLSLEKQRGGSEETFQSECSIGGKSLFSAAISLDGGLDRGYNNYDVRYSRLRR